MDYPKLIQRNITKITIGIAVAGVVTFTIWYYSSRQAEHEPYIQTEDINRTEKSISHTKKINQSNAKQMIEASNSFTNYNNGGNQSLINTTINNDTTVNGLRETKTDEQINVSSNNNIHTIDKIIYNDMSTQNEKSEKIITENTETQNEAKNEDEYHEIDEMSDLSATYKLSEYKAKYNSKNDLKIKINHSDEYKEPENSKLEIHARSEKISKQDRKVGRLNKNSFKFVKNNDDSTQQRGNTPRKTLKEDASWVKQRKLRNAKSSTHVVHPSIMELNLNKLVTDAKIIKVLSPISDEKDSLLSMKTTKRMGRKSNKSTQKQ